MVGLLSGWSTVEDIFQSEEHFPIQALAMEISRSFGRVSRDIETLFAECTRIQEL